ncbi:MAG: tRNA (cytidine(34)-2'-O)-methyltransferase [Bdellovibrionales bacterium]|nr:tRNA (cytidine(34)-2'-O)-methyltransferase [Bdellovibrionales bacterium]
MEIALVHPEIPGNTGNIGRSCVATMSKLHLVKPLGFSIEDRWLKRAGLDYWQYIDLEVHESLEHFLTSVNHDRLILFSRFAQKSYWDAPYKQDSILVFGSETKGLPEFFKDRFQDQQYLVPVPGKVRSLNLATCAGIALYEGIRQISKL